VESVGIVVIECEGAAPESAVDIRGFVPVYDLGLCCQIYWWDAISGLARFLGDQVNLALTWHVVEELRVERPAA
jgi:hypothetical protein